MTYTKIASPIGFKKGIGTYETVWASELYGKDMHKAILANDYVVIDFVQDEKGKVCFEAYHSKKPVQRLYHELQWQGPFINNFVDTRDDHAIMDLIQDLFIEHHPHANQ